MPSAQVPGSSLSRETQETTSPSLDLDVYTGETILGFALSGAGVYREQTRAALVDVEVDKWHRQQEGCLDIDPSEGFGHLGEVFTLTATRRYQWAHSLAGPLGDGVGLGAPSPVRPELRPGAPPASPRGVAPTPAS